LQVEELLEILWCSEQNCAQEVGAVCYFAGGVKRTNQLQDQNVSKDHWFDYFFQMCNWRSL